MATKKKTYTKKAPVKSALARRPSYAGRANVEAFRLTTEAVKPREPMRCVMGVNFAAPKIRTVVSIPEGVAERLENAVMGPKNTAIVALAIWALDELARQNKRLLVTPA